MKIIVILTLSSHMTLFPQVVWKTDRLVHPLSIIEQIFVNDPRVRVERSNGGDWNLHIGNVNISDEGVYTCLASKDEVIHVIKRVSLVVKGSITL